MITIKNENFSKNVLKALKRKTGFCESVVVRYDFYEDGKNGSLKIEVNNNDSREVVETPIEMSYPINDLGKRVKGICFLTDRIDASLDFVTRNHYMEVYRHGYEGDIKFVGKDNVYHISMLVLYNEKRTKRMKVTDICFDGCEMIRY